MISSIVNLSRSQKEADFHSPFDRKPQSPCLGWLLSNCKQVPLFDDTPVVGNKQIEIFWVCVIVSFKVYD